MGTEQCAVLDFFEVVVDLAEHVFVADFLVDNHLIEQTHRALEGKQCETADNGR